MNKKNISVIIILAFFLGIFAESFYHPQCSGAVQVEAKTDTVENTELVFWYADEACREFLENSASEYQATTGITVNIVYQDAAGYLEKIYDASLLPEQSEKGSAEVAPDAYLMWNDGLGTAYLYGVAAELATSEDWGELPEAAREACTYQEKNYAYPLFFNTVLLAYHTDCFETAPSSIQEILDYAQSNLLGAGVGNLLEWNLNDGFYSYPFLGAGIEIAEVDHSLLVSNKDQYEEHLAYVEYLSETLGLEATLLNRKQVVENFNIEETLTALVDSDDVGFIEKAADEYGICQLPMLNETLPMQGISQTGVLVVNAFSEQIPAAEQFLAYLCDERAALLEAETGHFSVEKRYVFSELALTAWQQYQNSASMPNTPDAPGFWLELQDTVKKMWSR